MIFDWKRHLMYRVAKQENGCWLWTGAKSAGRGGAFYGSVAYRGRAGTKPHRLMFALTFPEVNITSLQINHKCDNSLCINPDHLYAGTHADNMRDKKLRGRSHKMPGEANPKAKLTNADIRQVRIERARGRTCMDIAADYGMHYSTIAKILNGKLWGHVD